MCILFEEFVKRSCSDIYSLFLINFSIVRIKNCEKVSRKDFFSWIYILIMHFSILQLYIF